jgi:predicted transcriptional regulator
MEPQPEILSFVKALAFADRVRIVSVLAGGQVTQAEIAEQLHLPARDMFQRLSYLTHADILRELDGVYKLDEKVIATLAHGRQSPSP